MERERLLAQWQYNIVSAAHGGRLTGKPCQISRVYPISGPRIGVLELACSALENGALLRALRENDCARLRQLTQWDFRGAPQCFMHGRYVRVEAGWPSELAENLVRLGDLSKYPCGEGQWIAGKNECGDTVVPGLNDLTPHFLLSGTTGSGKSVALRNAILQLSADSTNEIVLIDGKMGESLRAVERLPNVIGPCAVDGPQVRAALGWVAAQMRNRYEAGYHGGRVIVAFDEFQEMAQDAVIVDLLRKLAAQGRGAGVHLLAATQHPIVKMFGDPSTRRNLTGRAAFLVNDADASRVAVGSAVPRADHLLGAGDCYLVAPGACHRIQGAYIDEQEITAGEGGGPAWRFQRWPDDYAEQIGQDLPAGQFSFTGGELGVALVSAAEVEGRTKFTARMDDAGFGRPGYNRQKRLRELGQDALAWMQAEGYTVCEYKPKPVEGAVPVPVIPDVW